MMIAIALAIILIFLVFVSGIIMLIIGLSKGNNKLSLPGGIMAGISIILFLVLFFYGIFKTLQGVGSGIKKMSEAIEEYEYEPEDSELMKKIKLYALDTVNVPENFYTDLGFRDYYRMPLPYPYFIDAIENTDCGKLNSDREFKPGYRNLGYITHLVFDPNYLLVRSSSEGRSNLENGTICFKIFNFRTHATFEYDSFEEMKTKAESLGFSEKIEFISLEDYYYYL